MKKILLFICILMLNLSFTMAEEKDLRYQESNLWSLEYLNRYVDESFSNIAKVHYKENGEVAFCIDPEVMMKPNSDYYVSSSSSLPTNIAKIIKAYKDSDRSDDLYIAAQLLIWNELGIYKTVESKNAYDFGASTLIDKMNQMSKCHRPSISITETPHINETVYLQDENNILSKGYYIESFSNGLEDVMLNGNELIFKISNIYPVNKEIVLKPGNNLNNILSEDFTVYLATGSQSLVSYKGNINDSFEGLKINFKHKTGNLIIRKLDEFYELTNDETTFRIYMIDDQGNIIDEIVKEDGSYFKTDDGILEIKEILPVGKYLIEEFKTSYKYINRGDSFIVDLKENDTITVDFINENRNLTLELLKKDNELDYCINDTIFSLYDISENLDLSENNIIFGTKEQVINDICLNEKEADYYKTSSLYLIKKDIEQDLDNIFSLADNQKLIDKNNVFYHDLYTFEDNGYIQLDLIEETEIPFESEIEYFKGNILYDKPYNEINIKDCDGNNIKSEIFDINFESEQTYNLRYTFDYDDNKFYMIIKGYLDNEVINDSKPLYYKYIDTYETYIINNDNGIFDDDFSKISSLKMALFKTGNSNIQIVNPDKHYYPIPNTEIVLYEDEDLNNEIDRVYTDEMGYINTEYEYETMYYKIDNKIMSINNISKDGYINYPYLKQDRKYLLCEDIPNNVYKYGDTDVCHLIDTYTANEDITTITKEITNEVRNINIELYKTNPNKKIRLDGAIFDIYLNRTRNNDIIIQDNDDNTEDNRFIGRFETGALNINHNDFDIKDCNYQIEIYKDKEYLHQLRVLTYHKEDIIINDLEEDTYYIVVRNIENNEIVKEIERDVSKGKIFIDNIPMNCEVIIKEIKAPKSYYFIDNVEKIKLSEYEIQYKLPYNRINHMIIINTKCYE